MGGWFRTAAVAAFIVAAAGAASAQSFPSRPVHIFVPYPAGGPADVLAKLSHDFVAALNTDAVKERLSNLGALPIGSSPQQFDARIHADYEKWGPIIKAAGMKAE